MNKLDVIIVGASQSGLAASYFLKKHQVSHIVFERGRIGESWLSQRWHSFKLNTANKLNVLPGAVYTGNDPDGFCTAAEYVASLNDYRTKFQLPVMENALVLSIEKEDDLFKVLLNNVVYYSKQLIICSGEMSEPKLPTVAAGIPPSIQQLHAGTYRHPQQTGATVLVVGSAQSGIQIAEELADAGKKVFLSTSMVPRVPGRYRGKDIMDWLLMAKFFDARIEDITDAHMLQMKAPQLTGIGECRRTISLQSLARRGVTLLGTMKDANEFLPNAAIHIQFADTFSQRAKAMIDEFIEAAQIEAPPAEIDEADVPANQVLPAITSLPYTDTIIWATGFGGNYSYLKMPVIDAAGRPIHKHGISPVEGLYFLGLHWLRTRKSGLIAGVADDADFIVNTMLAEKFYHKSI